MTGLSDPELTLDVLGGDQGLRLYQPRQGHRFGIEAVLLAFFATLRKNDRVVDLGTGVGILLLIIARRTKAKTLIGIEIQPELVEIARKNAQMNQVGLEVVQGDFRRMDQYLPPASAEVVVSNPPFGQIGRGRVSPDPSRALARHDIEGGFKDVVAAARHCLKDGGRLALIGPATRVADIFFEMRQGGIEPKRMRAVQGREGEPARLVLIEGVKGGGVECLIEQGLNIFEGQGGEYGPEVEEMLGKLS